MKIAFNLVAFQLGWFASTLGAANNLFWLGPIVVSVLFSIHLVLNGNYIRECLQGLTILLLGIIADTLLTILDVYTPKQFIFPYPLSPPWLFFMWLNFSTLINVSIKWLNKKYVLSALLGGIGGAVAYFGGDAFGALKYSEPKSVSMIMTGITWALLTPLCFYISNQLKKLI